MSAIELRSDLVRVANMFTHGNTGNQEFGQFRDVLKNILVEPHPSGKGAHIISCDGVALCVQHDTEGIVEGRYLLCGIGDEDTRRFSGNTINDNWLIGNEGKLRVTRNDASRPWQLDATYCRARLAGDDRDEPGLTTYPDWRQLLPDDDELDAMKPGFPGILSARYLSIISRMYEDGYDAARSVQFLHREGGGNFSNAFIRFPWRAGMLVVIAPMTGGAWADQWREDFENIVDFDDGILPDRTFGDFIYTGTPPEDDDADDPAAGL